MYLCHMRFDIITVLPSLLESPFAHSILQRAQKKGLAEIVVLIFAIMQPISKKVLTTIHTEEVQVW